MAYRTNHKALVFNHTFQHAADDNILNSKDCSLSHPFIYTHTVEDTSVLAAYYTGITFSFEIK